MNLVCEYKTRIQNLEKSEHFYNLLMQTLANRVSIDSSESNLLKSLERAVSLQREDANRLQKELSIMWINL